MLLELNAIGTEHFEGKNDGKTREKYACLKVPALCPIFTRISAKPQLRQISFIFKEQIVMVKISCFVVIFSLMRVS